MSEFTYSPWRHGGWYVDNVRYPSGAVGCVSSKMINPATGEPDGRWRIACDSREGDHSYRTRDEAAWAERCLIAEGVLGAEKVRWNFWLPDEDRSAGWTNHCYVLQYVCRGEGRTAEEAWADAKANGQVPEGFHLPDAGLAIRLDAEDGIEFT